MPLIPWIYFIRIHFSMPMPPISRKRKAAVPPRIEHLEKMLSMTRFIDQLKRLIDQPIKIPGTLSMHQGQQLRNKQIPGKAKRDLLSVEDIWGSQVEQTEKSTLYNVEDVGERKWLLDLLMEESDPDSGGEEHITEQDLKEILKIHKRRRKFQKEYHSDKMNSQYRGYSAGLISASDRFSENQKNVRKELGNKE